MNIVYLKGFQKGKKHAENGFPNSFDRIIQGVFTLMGDESVTEYVLGYQNGYQSGISKMNNTYN